jgi:hypothetical protein
MSTFTNNNVSSGDVVRASDHNTQGANIAAVVNGDIDNANISATAAIAGSKLADASVEYIKMGVVTAFRLTSSTTSIPASAFTKALFTVESYDQGNNQTGSTFTAPADGIYNFSAALVLTGTGSTNWGLIALYKNGTAISRGTRRTVDSTFDIQMQISSSLSLSSGDTIEVYVFQSSAGSKSLTGTATENYFDGHRLR